MAQVEQKGKPPNEIVGEDRPAKGQGQLGCQQRPDEAQRAEHLAQQADQDETLGLMRVDTFGTSDFARSEPEEKQTQ